MAGQTLVGIQGQNPLSQASSYSRTLLTFELLWGQVRELVDSIHGSAAMPGLIAVQPLMTPQTVLYTKGRILGHSPQSSIGHILYSSALQHLQPNVDAH